MRETILRLASCGSTNTELLRLAESGAAARTTVVALHQTAGRGRAGHTWEAPPGSSLLFSTLLRPRLPMETLPLATLAVGLGVCEGVRTETGLDAGLKWPNDLLVHGRKCAGVLCEGVPVSAEGGAAIVAGVGVNVSTPAEALPRRAIFPATSLALEGATPDPERLLQRLLEAIWRWCGVLEETGGAERVVERFREWDALRGRALRVELPGGTSVEGRSLGVAPSGALRLQTSAGPLDIVAGSLSLAEGLDFPDA